MVGPQTFSLVEAEEIPQSKADREACMKAGHICRRYSGGTIKGDGPAKVVPAMPVSKVWDTWRDDERQRRFLVHRSKAGS